MNIAELIARVLEVNKGRVIWYHVNAAQTRVTWFVDGEIWEQNL